MCTTLHTCIPMPSFFFTQSFKPWQCDCIIFWSVALPNSDISRSHEILHMGHRGVHFITGLKNGDIYTVIQLFLCIRGEIRSLVKYQARGLQLHTKSNICWSVGLWIDLPDGHHVRFLAKRCTAHVVVYEEHVCTLCAVKSHLSDSQGFQGNWDI